MSSIWIFFTEKKALSYLILIALSIFGVGAALTIQRESSPEVQVPVAVISSVLPGASPEDVETLLVEEIEAAVADLEDVKKLTSTSREGVGTVVVEFDAAADIDESINTVKDRVDLVRADLPDDATDPIVSEVNFADQPIVIASVVSDLPVTEFRTLTDELVDEIESVPGVSRAEVTGMRDREVSVVLRKEALATYGLTVDAVVGALRTNDLTAPVGALIVEGVEYPLTLEGRIEDTSTVTDIPVRTANGAVVRIGEVAFVADGVEPVSSLARVSIGGEAPLQAATLLVYKERGADITRMSADVRDIIAARNAAGSSEVELVVTFDAGEQIINDLRQLTTTGLQTVALVLLVLILALGWREAFIAALSIPLSFLTAFIVMEATGNTINFISLFSLILSIGILVDTAIVMTEAIHTNVKRGQDKRTAVRTAIREFSYPVTTGNLTTIAVFGPLFTISGVTGEFIDSIPFTVIAVLVSSLIISLAFIPLIASTFLHRASSRMEEKQDAFASNLRAWYRRHIVWLIDSRKRKWGLVGSLTALLILLVMAPFFGFIRVAFFPQSDVDYLYVNIEEPQGTPLARTDLSVRVIEDALLDMEDVKFFTTSVGAGSPFDQNPSAGPRFASVTLNLAEDRTRSSSEILKDVEARLAPYSDLDYQVLQPSEGPPSGAPVLVTFFGDTTEELKLLANDAADVLREVEGTRAVRSSAEDDANAFSLTIDRARAAELGVSLASVAGTLRGAVFGTEAITIKTGGEEIDVVVRVNLARDWNTPEEAAHATLDAVRELTVPGAQGPVALGSVLTATLDASSDTIRREDEKRIATVQSQVADGYVAREVSAAFERAFMENRELPAGVVMRLGGETEDVDQSFADTFRALGIGILLVFAVLVVQFNQFRQAFIVLTVVPLSLIGVLLGLLITGEYLSFPTMLGFIALAGVVVNNAIILVDVFNRMREDHPAMPLREVVIEGAAVRLRPILLTAITTIVGIAPLMFASDLWRPIATAIMFGLAFAVVLTLMLVPALYLKLCKKPRDVVHGGEDTGDEESEVTAPRMEHVGDVLKERYSVSSLLKRVVPIGVLVLLVVPMPLAAFTYTNENIHTVYHEAPAYFLRSNTGEVSGATVSGMVFRQYNILPHSGYRLQRFQIGEAFWYVSDRGVIWAASDLEALSIYLSSVA